MSRPRTLDRRRPSRARPILLGVAALLATGCGEPGAGSPSRTETPRGPAPAAATITGPVTFNRHVAPIVYEHCAACHQPDGAGPFPLLTYEDVRRHAGQIAAVTASGFMPPWLPAPDVGAFIGERRLSASELDVLRRWAEDGAPEGDPSDRRPVPALREGWQLGPPDLVVTMPEPFTVPAEGVDVFRNFVIPVTLPERRWVRAVELQPGNQKVVHHAILMTDPARQARGLDAADAAPGYEGMDAVFGQAPDGHFLGWTPGKVPDDGSGGIPWRLDPGTDLVLQLHMVPSGRPEPIRPTIGLYFGDPPPGEARTYTLYMKAPVDIPPGARDYTATETFRLPVSARLEEVYPHAHYLGKAISAHASRPDGSSVALIRIDDWDFNWQDSYRYVEPLALPAGSTITMTWAFDNSADNVRNPHRPPRRVVSGNRTTDEMAHLYLQLRVSNPRDEQLLLIADAAHQLQRAPGDWILHTTIAGGLQAVGRLAEAADHCNQALTLKPDHAPAWFCLALVRELEGRLDESGRAYSRAVEHDPANALMRTSLAEVLVKQARLDEAESQLLQALELDDRVSDAHTLLGNVCRLQGRRAEAVEHYERALALRPDDLRANSYLGAFRAEEGRNAEALRLFQAALREVPDHPGLNSSLGRVLLAEGDVDQAIAHFRRALAVQPDHPEARRYLELATQRRGGG